MTQRLYYTDSFATQFTAVLQEQFTRDGQTAGLLNETLFYPTSGGQPHDTGSLNGRSVSNVTFRNDDDAILHWVTGAAPLAADITGQINWERRFDHMQQHSGQHILSQAFIQVAAAETVGFHLSPDSVTIDLNVAQLSDKQLARAEQIGNEIVWQNRPFTIRFTTPAAAAQLPLRKVPSARAGKLRLIEIADFDLTACGGTHVARSGGVGLIKIIKTERRNEKLRVAFACGGRALDDYTQKNAVVADLMSQLTTGAPELASAVARLQAENKELRRQAKKQTAVLLAYEADTLWRQAAADEPMPVIIGQVFTDCAPGQLRQLGQQLIQHEGTIALLGLAGEKAQLLFGRSDDLALDMNQLLQRALPLLGEARGGGSPALAQGGGTAVSPAALERVLQQAQAWIHEVGTFS